MIPVGLAAVLVLVVQAQDDGVLSALVPTAGQVLEDQPHLSVQHQGLGQGGQVLINPLNDPHLGVVALGPGAREAHRHPVATDRDGRLPVNLAAIPPLALVDLPGLPQGLGEIAIGDQVSGRWHRRGWGEPDGHHRPLLRLQGHLPPRRRHRGLAAVGQDLRRLVGHLQFVAPLLPQQRYHLGRADFEVAGDLGRGGPQADGAPLHL